MWEPVQVLAAALDQVWPAFALVAALLLLGRIANDEGLFDYAAWWLNRLPGEPLTLYLVSMALVAIVTAILNLDTAVIFMTPILLFAARARAIDEVPFLYGALFMANASSLYLPGSNLTNLLVLANEPTSGGAYAAALLPAASAATLSTTLIGALMFRRRLRTYGSVTPIEQPPRPGGLAVSAVAVAALLTVLLPAPALPVLSVAIATALLHRLGIAFLIDAVKPLALGILLALSVGLGVVGRMWGGPAALLSDPSSAATAAMGAMTAIAVNNLPAAVLLSAQPPPHARALLIGLNLGPNLAVTGSLSAYLWFRSARLAGAQPSVGMVSRYGVVIAPVAIALAVAADTLGGP